MNHFIFSAVLVFLVSFPIALFFLFKKSPSPQPSPSGRGKGEGKYFGLFWLAVAFWTFFVGFQFQIMDQISAKAWSSWLHIGCISVPIVFYHFSLVWACNPNRGLLWLGYGLFLVFMLLNLFTGLFTAEDVFRTYYHYPKPSVLYPVYIFYFQFYGVLATWHVFELRKKIVAPARKFLYLFLIIHLFAWAGSMDNYLIMYDKLIFPFYPYGLYAILPYVTVGSWAFLKLSQNLVIPESFSRGSKI